jgi:hypothetical protein
LGSLLTSNIYGKSTNALIILSYDVGLTISPDFLDRLKTGCGDVNGDSVTKFTDAFIELSFNLGFTFFARFVNHLLR